MTDYLDEIQARADAATDGPWFFGLNPLIGGYAVTTVPPEEPFDVEADVADFVRLPDAKFIAHARTDMPRLVAFAKAVLELGHDAACHDDVECDCNIGNIRWLAAQHLGGDR